MSFHNDPQNIYHNDLRYQPYDLQRPQNRPGIPPRLSDNLLTPEELCRRNARRKRNREAAQRCRERRLERVTELENQVRSLQEEKDELKVLNDQFKKEIADLKLQLEMKNVKEEQEKLSEPKDKTNNESEIPVSEFNVCQGETTPGITPGITPLQSAQVKFEFPDMSDEAKSKARQTSLTEFNNFLLKQDKL